MLNFKFLKRISFFFVLAFALFSHNVSLAQERSVEAESLTKIEIKDVKIEKKESAIEISAVLENPSMNMETSFFTYLVTLKSINPLVPPKSFDIDFLVSAVEGVEYLSLKPLQENVFNYSLPIGEFFPSDDYSFSLKLIKNNGELLGSYSKIIYSIDSNKKEGKLYKNGFLAFDHENCFLTSENGEQFNANEGPIFSQLAEPVATCLVKNISSEEIKVYPFIEWKEFYVYGKPSSQKTQVLKVAETINFKSGESKLVKVALPKLEKPQIYQALIRFLDNDNDQIRSYYMPFRWTIKGRSARIEAVTLNSALKENYKKGETVSLSIDYFGSMDLFWKGKENVTDLGDVKFQAKIMD